MFTKISKVLLWLGIIAGVIMSIAGSTIGDGKFWWIFPVGVIATLVVFSLYGMQVEMASNIARIRHSLEGTNNQPVVNAAAQPAQSIGWTCPECGEVNDKYTRFCSKCGKKFSQQSTESADNQPSVWKCPKCGVENDKNALYCKVCGKYK